MNKIDMTRYYLVYQLAPQVVPTSWSVQHHLYQDDVQMNLTAD